YFKNDGLQNQAVLYRAATLHGEAAVALDPNALSADGTTAVTSMAISDDGRLLAYGISVGGSDRQEIRIRNLETGLDYADVLEHCRFANIAWKHDENNRPLGFFYNRDPEPDPDNPSAPPLHNKVYWHVPGTPQTADSLIYARPDAPTLKFGPQITEDGRFLILFVWHAAIARNRLFYRAMESDGDFVRLIDDANAYYTFVGNVGDTFYIQTNWQAPNGRLLAIDLAQAQQDNWREILPETNDILVSVNIVNNQLVAINMHNACHQISVFDLEGNPTGAIDVPALSAITGQWGKQCAPDYFFKVESFIDPGTVFHYNLETGELTAVWETAVSFQRDDYVTEQVFFPSKDGTPVSMFLTHKKGISLDGQNPALLYGYGGFNINHNPAFAAHAIYWLESGGIYADVNLRGGSEYGEAWHQAGMLANKQNVFDDFIAAAEHLVTTGYTQPAKLAILGRSNGGLLTAAVMLQRPDLFGAVLSVVPVTDMLRFHKFTAGRYWTDEYGNAEENPEHFRFMIAYSPLHNVRKGVVYPPILLTTADGDDRVVPMHAMKFTATLQAAANGRNPILVRIDTKSGHGLGKPTSKWIDEWADIYTFLRATVQSK
ncbi:MAG: S9 family peptidase, partial [Anaerolineales bacterium]|nr:S9 family peptidase [Anaerolineales bacterium]